MDTKFVCPKCGNHVATRHGEEDKRITVRFICACGFEGSEQEFRNILI